MHALHTRVLEAPSDEYPRAEVVAAVAWHRRCILPMRWVMHITLHVNGSSRDIDVAPGARLLSVLRDELGLTGARFGCGHGECGACVVLVDGEPVPACTTSVEEAAGRTIETI